MAEVAKNVVEIFDDEIVALLNTIKDVEKCKEVKALLKGNL